MLTTNDCQRNSSHFTIHVYRFSFSNFGFIIIIRYIFLVLLRRSSHPASGSFFREDEKKNSRSTASGLDERCTMFQVFIILIISFSLAFGIPCSFEVIFRGRQEHSIRPGREMNIVQCSPFYLYTNSFFPLVLLWTTRKQTQSRL